MRAAVLTTLNSKLEIMHLEPQKLSPGQVLVRILVSGLCGAQLQEIAGFKGNANFLPHLMGHEGCGIVEAIGDGVTNVKVGDKVVMHWRPSLGNEADFPKYRSQTGELVSGGKVTTLSEKSVVSENRLTVVPKETPSELAALLGCGLSTALGVVAQECNLKFGESILVVGCGGLGLGIIQAARLSSASPIIGADITPSKESLVKEIGADWFINPVNSNIGDELEKITGLRSVDAIVDTTGIPEVLASLIPLLSNKGRLVLVAQPKPGSVVNFPIDSKFFGTQGKTIKSTQGGGTFPSEDIPRYLELFRSGKLEYQKVITHTFGLEKINEAFDVLRSGNAGRVMIRISND